MLNFIIQAAPTSLLFIAIVVFLGLMFKIATQNVNFPQRSMKYTMNKFFLCLTFTLALLPLVTVIAASDMLVSNFFLRMLPVLLAAFSTLGCVHAFLDVLRFHPKDAPKQSKEDLPLSGN